MAINYTKEVSKRDETRTRFAGLILQRLRSDGVTKAQFDADSYSIRVFDVLGTIKSSLLLEQVFGEYIEASPSARNTVIDRYVATVRTTSASLPTTLRRAAYNVLPRIAPRFVLEEMELSAHIKGLTLHVPAASSSFSTVPTQPVGAHHMLSLVYDFPTHVVTLQKNTLEDWGASFEEVLEIGKRNLLKMSPEPFEELCEGLYVSPFSDNHDTSRLLLTDKIFSECRVKGEHVAFLLNRDTLLIADSSIPAALRTAAAIAGTTLQEPRPFSAFPLIFRDNCWQDFQLNEFHPAFDEFRQLHIINTAEIYNRQKLLLEEFNAKTYQDQFVATCVVLKEPTTDELFSFATWTEGVDTLLPASEHLVLVQPDQPENRQNMRCTFKRALEVVPHLLERTGLYPERYRARRFPSKSELLELEP